MGLPVWVARQGAALGGSVAGSVGTVCARTGNAPTAIEATATADAAVTNRIPIERSPFAAFWIIGNDQIFRALGDEVASSIKMQARHPPRV